MKQSKSIIDPKVLLSGYMEGVFPMADSKNGRVSFYISDPRAIIPLTEIKVPKSLRQFLRKNNYYYKIDSNFEEVIKNCANRNSTWINDLIIDSYIELHNLGFAHSVETYLEEKLIGGLYGVSIGGAFFGESMFYKKSNASKAAFYHLIEHLKNKGFILLDTQFINEHTKLLGAIEIPLSDYLIILNKAIKLEVEF